MLVFCMVKRIIVAGRPSKNDYILKFRGSNTYHRVPANSLLEAKAKMLKGTRYTFGEVEIMSLSVLRRWTAQKKREGKK